MRTDRKLCPAETLWLTVLVHAERDLREGHAAMAEFYPLIRDLIAHRANLGPRMQRSVREMWAVFQTWRIDRAWFVGSGESFPLLCGLFEVNVEWKRGQLRDVLYLEFGGAQIEVAVDRYRRDLADVGKICRRRARARYKEKTRLGYQVRKADAGVPRSDDPGPARSRGVRGAEAAGPDVEAGAAHSDARATANGLHRGKAGHRRGGGGFPG